MRAHADASYLHLIVNEGPLAGASLEHTHAQLYALDFVPPEIARERERAVAYHERTMGGHLLEDVATEEIRRRDRLVAIDDDTLLVCPWASRSPFHLRVIPRRRRRASSRPRAGAAMIATAMRALGGALGGVPQLNLWVRTAPRGADEFCWHIEILPRLTIRAGFELGPRRHQHVSARARGERPARGVGLSSSRPQGRGALGARDRLLSAPSPSPTCSSSAPTTGSGSTRAPSTAARLPTAAPASPPITC